MMFDYLDRLNLRPFEKRLVVVFIIVLFIVVNFLFIWPRFNDWAKTKTRITRAKANQEKYQAEIKQVDTYKKRLEEFKGSDTDVPPADQAIQLSRTIQNQASQSGVLIVGTGRSNTRTNDMFIEQQLTVTVQTGEKQLVDFLHKLGAGDSMIRVRDIGLRPDASRYQLTGNITLVASYQREDAGKAAPSARPPARRPTPSSTTPASRPVRSQTPS